ncbi:hypothetical protein BDV12DRAFT_194170 [Aspergillus spectabilis]
MSETQKKSFGLWLCKRIASLVLPTRPPNEPLIFSLPECLIRDIFDLLPLADQACLALACKLYQYLFSKVLKREEFRFPRFKDLIKPSISVFIESAPRNQLLIRLENSHWAYCSGCMKLHPRKEFNPQSVLERPPMERRCMPSAGVVNLCPCICITPRNKTRIIRFLKRKSACRTRPVDRWEEFEVQTDRHGKASLTHQCWIADNDGVLVQLSMDIEVKDWLKLTAHYRYIVSEDRKAGDRGKRVILSPHLESLVNCLDGRLLTKCVKAELDANAKTSQPLNPVVVRYNRPLGGPGWPVDEEWSRQCRQPVDRYYEDIWRRTQKKSK